MKLTEKFRNKLQLAVYEAAEKLASEVTVDGERGYEMEVIVDDLIFYLLVDCTISNLVEEEETNSRHFNVAVYCMGTPSVIELEMDQDLYIFIYEKFHLETLYTEQT